MEKKRNAWKREYYYIQNNILIRSMKELNLQEVMVMEVDEECIQAEDSMNMELEDGAVEVLKVDGDGIHARMKEEDVMYVEPEEGAMEVMMMEESSSCSEPRSSELRPPNSNWTTHEGAPVSQLNTLQNNLPPNRSVQATNHVEPKVEIARRAEVHVQVRSQDPSSPEYGQPQSPRTINACVPSLEIYAEVMEESVVGLESQIEYLHHHGKEHTPLPGPTTIIENDMELGQVIGLQITDGINDWHLKKNEIEKDECICTVQCEQYCTEVDECVCTARCGVYCGGIGSDEKDRLAGIKYCPGTDVELPKYFHVDYKGSSSRRWPVQYQHCAGRAVEMVSIPRLEITDVPIDKDDKEMGIGEESWTTGLEEVRRMWMKKEEGREERSLLPTDGRRGERRVSQEFENLCQKFENWGGGGETSGTRRVETEYPAIDNYLHSFSKLQNFIQVKETFRPRPRHNNITNSPVIRGAASLATPTANRKRERSGDSEMVGRDDKKWKV